MKKIFLTAFLSLSLLVSINAQEAKPAKIQYYSQEFLDEIKATPEQKDAIKVIVDKAKAATKEVKANTALSDDDKKAELTKINKERTTAYYQILTPEQNKYIKEKRKQLAAEAANSSN